MSEVPLYLLITSLQGYLAHKKLPISGGRGADAGAGGLAACRGPLV